MNTVSLMRIEEPPRADGPEHRPFALWRLGFRPFYLLASSFAALSIGAWAMQYAGWLPGAYLQGPLWHAHEMVFGFALAVIVGFLFTAGRNWTNRPTPTGAALAALAALWVAGRVLVLTPFPLAAAVVSAAFPLAAAVALAIPFFAARNQRNYFFVALLVLMAVADALFHLTLAGLLSLPGNLGIQVALDAVLFIMAVMGGRVIPMFTNNGVPGAAATRNARLETAVLGMTLVLLPLDLLHPGLVTLPAGVVATVLAVCAALHAARWWRWQPWTTTRTPIVWVLHVAYLWIIVHLALRAAAALGWAAPSVATHALTVGAIGGLIIGMITRTARGHTGRPLRAGRGEVVAYVLVALAAVVRTFVPLFAPSFQIASVTVSAAMWSAAFAIYAVVYWPILTRPRLDGRPG
ncbi:MAG: NnrS family protein [Betaproteobacteria bacterium]|nr:NnrS family protein [Betaproteobacteria bacterium]